MFYLKNLPVWERLVRFVAGLAMISSECITTASRPAGPSWPSAP